jgi:glycosyltransferase involved in cell wall biosynthesis
VPTPTSASSAPAPRIRLIRVIARLNVGGPAQQAILLTAALRERYPTLLVTGHVGPGEVELDALAARHAVSIMRIPELGRSVRPLDDLRALWKLWQLCREVRPDIVHTHTAKAGTLGRLAALLAGVPVRVHTFHGHVFGGYFGRLKTAFFLGVERVLARLTTRIVAISPLQARELCAYLRVKPERVTVVPLGLELHRFAASAGDGAARQRFRQAIGAGDDAVVVTIVGRLTAIKNHALGLRALAQVLPRHPEVLLAIVGGGEEEPALRRLAEELHVAARVRFGGWWDDLPAVYYGSDIVALTSDNEGTPVCLIEALACGRPVVSTAVGGVADVLEQGILGKLVPARDVAAFASALEGLLEPEARARWRGLAASRTIERYAIERLASDLARLYSELLVARAPAVLHTGR